jgi:phthalate 4,5-dioxygenase reductase subunit
VTMDRRVPVVVSARRMLTAEVCEFVLRPADGSLLAPAAAGAHINVDTPSGETRSYSLTGDVADRSRHVIAVRRDEQGRGGSRSLVDSVAAGDGLSVSEPRNSFALESFDPGQAPGHLLIAAGIGITPVRAMLIELRRSGIRDVQLVYLSRSPAETPYLEELSREASSSSVTLHHRRQHGPIDWWPLLETPGDRRLYVCGTESLHDDIRALTMHWRPSRVRYENFSGVSAFGEISLPFEVEWQPSGSTIAVQADQTMLGALIDAGLDVPSSCESGTCGTCRLRLLGGEADHRDVVLDETERTGFVMPCVSRAADDRLVVAPLD